MRNRGYFMSKKLRCPSCKAIIDADESQKTVHCDGCGKNYKNPYYKEIEVVENGSEAQEAVVSPANVDANVNTDKKPNDNVSESTVQSEAIVPSVSVEEKTDGINEEKLAKAKKKLTKSIIAILVLSSIFMLYVIAVLAMNLYFSGLRADVFKNATECIFLIFVLTICIIASAVLCKNRKVIDQKSVTCLIIILVSVCLIEIVNIVSLSVGVVGLLKDPRYGPSSLFSTFVINTIISLPIVALIILSAVNLKNIKPFIPKYVVPAHLDGHSEFNAGLLSLIWLNFVNNLIIRFTLGLCTPWAVRREYTWLYEHQVIDDRKLVFNGNAASLFGQWVKWTLLSFITFGIYGLFVPIKKMQWVTKNTHIKDVVIDTQENKSEFDGKFWSYWGMRIVNGLIVVFSLGFCAPWAIVREQRWLTEHQIFDGQRLAFDGSAMGLFGQWVKWMLLSIITLGIYAWWIPIKKQKWITEHTHFSINA